MMEQNRRRKSKPVYVLSDLSDDDDFADFTPPTKKKKDTLKKNKENVEDLKFKKRPIIERKSPEEKKFERELELALELSSKPNSNGSSQESVKNDKTILSPFSGFLKDEKFCNSPNSSLDELDDKSISESMASTIILPPEEEDCNSEDDKKEDLGKEVNVLDEKSKVVQEDGSEIKELMKKAFVEVDKVEEFSLFDDPVEGTSNGLTAKRKTKKTIRFLEESSDDFCESDHDDFAPHSESDEEFQPKKKKKTPHKKESKTRKNKSPIIRNKKDKVDEFKVSLKAENLIELPSATKSPKCATSPKIVLEKSPKLSSKVLPKKEVIPLASKTNNILPKSTNNSISKPSAINMSSKSSSPGSGLVKTQYKCPTIAGVVQPWSNSNSPTSSGSVKSGLRLGLSRRGRFKPLHPNAGTTN